MEPTDEQLEEIAKLVKEGNTEGRLEGEDGVMCYWKLTTEIWKE